MPGAAVEIRKVTSTEEGPPSTGGRWRELKDAEGEPAGSERDHRPAGGRGRLRRPGEHRGHLPGEQLRT